MSMLKVILDTAALNALPRKVARAHVRAARRTLKRTSAWTKTQGIRRISHAHGIPVGALRRAKRSAINVRVSQSVVGAIVWFGILPLHAIRVGQARKTPEGVRVKDYEFPGSFIATMRSGHTGVFKRKGISRLPIQEQSVRLYSAQSALAGLQAEVPAQLGKVYLQEINYQFNVKGVGK